MQNVNGIDNSVLTLDPVSLVGRECFEPITHNVKLLKPFLLLFMIEIIPLAVRIVNLVAAKNNLDVVEFTTYYECHRFTGTDQAKTFEYCLGMMNDASYVVTPSFHAATLSILIHNKFTAVSTRASMNERRQSFRKCSY